MREMKKLALLGLVMATILSFSAGQTLAHAMHSPETNATPQFVEQAFAATHAHMTGFEVHDWTTLHNEFVPVQTLVTEAHTYAADLGLTNMHVFTHQDAQDHVAQWSGTVNFGPRAPRVTATVEMASMVFPDAPAQTVLILRYLGFTDDEQVFPKAYARLAQAARYAGGVPKINATLFGTMPRMLAIKARARTIAAAFQAADAKPMQAMTYLYTTSIAGFGAASVPTLRAGQQTIDLQVAMHENSFEQNTRVLVGSPIITLEY